MGLLVYSWMLNTYQIEFAVTKNQHYHNRIIQDIKDSNDIDSVKIQAIKFMEGIHNHKVRKNNRAILESKVQALTIFLLLILLALIMVELKKRT